MDRRMDRDSQFFPCVTEECVPISLSSSIQLVAWSHWPIGTTETSILSSLLQNMSRLAVSKGTNAEGECTVCGVSHSGGRSKQQRMYIAQNQFAIFYSLSCHSALHSSTLLQMSDDEKKKKKKKVFCHPSSKSLLFPTELTPWVCYY